MREDATIPLLPLVEKYLQTKDMSPRHFGMAALHDPNFVFDLRRGRKAGRRTVERVTDFILSDESKS